MPHPGTFEVSIVLGCALATNPYTTAQALLTAAAPRVQGLSEFTSVAQRKLRLTWQGRTTRSTLFALWAEPLFP